ncbi:MAG: MFS transporter [Myxococcota bacterium]
MTSPAPAPGNQWSALELLRVPVFRRLWGGAVLFSLGQWMERTAIGWFVLDLTGSVFLTALVWSVRTMPNLVFGPLAGAIADRHQRRSLLALNAAVRAAIVLVLGLVALVRDPSVVGILVLVALSGMTMTLQLAALQSLAGELAGAGRLASAVSLMSFGQRSVGAVGALSSGFLIAGLGAGATFLLAVVPLVLGALAFASVPPTTRTPATTRLSSDVLEGLHVVFRVRIVGLLLGLMVVVEILGFSYNSLLPAVAERTLGVGPEGLGALMSGAAVGSMAGTGFLAALADRARHGRLLIGVIALFGILLVLLGVSHVFAVSLLVVSGIGAMAALVDALEWTLLQASVDERLRGRVLGAWNHAIGWGWIGPVVLGALAEGIGVGNALALSGALLGVTGGLVALQSRQLRHA